MDEVMALYTANEWSSAEKTWNIDAGTKKLRHAGYGKNWWQTGGVGQCHIRRAPGCLLSPHAGSSGPQRARHRPGHDEKLQEKYGSFTSRCSRPTAMQWDSTNQLVLNGQAGPFPCEFNPDMTRKLPNSNLSKSAPPFRASLATLLQRKNSGTQRPDNTGIRGD